MAETTELMICVKCLAGQDAPEGGIRPGQALFDAIKAKDTPEGVTVTAVECLQNCNSGCSAAMRGGARKWTYVYGNLDVDKAQMLLDGTAAYHAAPDGLIPWRQRPEHFKRNCIARIPPMEASND
ncbi:MAG: DUF1636 family protein [Planktomarina sp.]